MVAKAAPVDMTNRWFINGLLLCIALGLGAFLWDRPKVAAPARARKLAVMKAASVSTVEVQRKGQPTILLKREGSRWLVLKPLKARADRFRVEALTDLVQADTSDRFKAPQDRLAGFGLAPPQAVLTLNKQRVLVGRRRPFGDLRYVLMNHTIALVPAAAIHPRRLSPNSFLSTKLLSARIHPVGFALPHFAIIRKRGIWRAIPKVARVSSDRINAFVDAWRYARALSVSRYHGQAVLGRIVIRYRTQGAKKPGPPQALTIDILATQPELVLARPDQGLEYHFPEEIGRRLLHLGPDARTP